MMIHERLEGLVVSERDLRMSKQGSWSIFPWFRYQIILKDRATHQHVPPTRKQQTLIDLKCFRP